MEPDFIFPARNATFTIRRGTLPHWTLERVLYFVTFRLADSVPAAARRKQAMRLEPPQSSAIRGDALVARERWLDRGMGSCALAIPECKEIVENALRHFAGDRYYLDRFVVAPNHVHVLVAPWAPWRLTDIVKSWKAFSSRRIHERFGDRLPTLRERVWQRESFDHIVRTPIALEEFREYIRAHRAFLHE